MRINIVTGFFLPVPPLRGGATEKIWNRLAIEFAGAGHDVTIVSRRWPGLRDDETERGVRHIRLPGTDHSRSLATNLWQDLRWGRRVTKALPSADITICNTVMLPIWLRGSRPDAGHVVAVMARMPKGQARFYGKVDLVLSLTEAVTAALLKENASLRERIAPFPFPIDWKLHADARLNRRAKPAVLRIGFIGRINPEKGVALLLDAAAILAARSELVGWELHLIGPTTVADGGGGEDYLRGLVERYRPALGARLSVGPPEFDPVKLARLYADLDVFCYPSLAERGETFGVAVAEAMAAGAAPIVSNLPCFRDLVLDGDTGLVFEHRSADAAVRLASCCERLLRNTAERGALALRASAFARRFDYSVVAETVLGHLTRLVRRGATAHNAT